MYPPTLPEPLEPPKSPKPGQVVLVLGIIALLCNGAAFAVFSFLQPASSERESTTIEMDATDSAHTRYRYEWEGKDRLLQVDKYPRPDSLSRSEFYDWEELR